MAQLAVAHELGQQRSGATQLAAQLAHDPGGALIDVDALPDERGALAVEAAMAVGCERSHSAPQEIALELLHIAVRRGHACRFAVLE
jgi:hypothetical protein